MKNRELFYSDYERVKEKMIEWHGDQKRKYTNAPYWTHPVGVAEILMSIDCIPPIVYAGLLHDVIEDTEVEFADIAELFGTDVAILVDWVTDLSKPEDGNRATRKEIDRVHLSYAPDTAKTIKLADLIHNSRSILKYDRNFSQVYIREKQQLLEVLKGGHPALHAWATDIVNISMISLVSDWEKRV